MSPLSLNSYIMVTCLSILFNITNKYDKFFWTDFNLNLVVIKLLLLLCLSLPNNFNFSISLAINNVTISIVLIYIDTSTSQYLQLMIINPTAVTVYTNNNVEKLGEQIGEQIIVIIHKPRRYVLSHVCIIGRKKGHMKRCYN